MAYGLPSANTNVLKGITPSYIPPVSETSDLLKSIFPITRPQLPLPTVQAPTASVPQRQSILGTVTSALNDISTLVKTGASIYADTAQVFKKPEISINGSAPSIISTKQGSTPSKGDNIIIPDGATTIVNTIEPNTKTTGSNEGFNIAIAIGAIILLFLLIRK